jgi:electron transfer flavoprotein alpha subunit
MLLVIAEHDNHQLKPSTLNTITAAKQLSQEITVLVAGEHCKNVAEACAHITDVTRVILADASCYAHQLPENLAKLVVQIANGYSYILASATSFGKNCLPRVAAMLDATQISDVVQIIDHNTFIRPIYAGNALTTVQVNDAIKLLTIRTTAFVPAIIGNQTAIIENYNEVHETNLSSFISQNLTPSARPELSAAKIVVAGGRGMQSAEKFKLIEELADCLGAAIGASRAAVDAGFVPNDYQVGQTGKVVAPHLYIAIGISGAIQHLAGMKDSKIIVAINKDADAPIFQMADYGLVGDLFEIVPALIAELKKIK